MYQKQIKVMQTAIKTPAKDNIVAPKLEGPKVVTKIDLNAAVPAKKQFHILGTFPIKHYEAVVNLAKKVNKSLKTTDAITVSKLAKVEGKEAPELGTIWYSCDREVCFAEFQKPMNLMLVEIENNCRRINKVDMLNMPFGQEFFMVYIFKNNTIKASHCVKIYTKAKQAKEGVSFVRLKDPNQNANMLIFGDINDDGTFKTDNAEGCLFVSNETFTADL